MKLFRIMWRRLFARRRKSYRELVMEMQPVAMYLLDDPEQGTNHGND